MNEYEFTLKYKLPEASSNPESHLKALDDAGCDDALIGIGQQGRIALSFSREASSANEAMLSAIENIKQAIPNIKLIEVSPDFVGLTDVADLLNFSRQNMRKVMLKGGSNFPTPIHEGKTPIWHLASILEWLKENKNYEINDAVFDISKFSMQLNSINNAPKINKSTQRDITTLLHH